jgi:alkylation response protein AidB-like acyl-CoA dehydrogenase
MRGDGADRDDGRMSTSNDTINTSINTSIDDIVHRDETGQRHADRIPIGMLERFRERAADHDRDGTFPVSDLDELASMGWLRAVAPVEVGGAGLDLSTFAAAQRELARYAPATALSTTMHHYWVGTAATLHSFGVPIGGQMLRWIADGEILASGHAEAGNDVPIALSTTRAERVVGGWRLHGRKMFGSLGPVWDRLGFHAMDTSNADGPVIVHGFVRRDAPGVTVEPTWDAHGMRATESHDTVLDGAFVPDGDVLCVVPAGPPTDLAVGIMFIWAGTLIANVYVGIAERALELACGEAASKTSIGLGGRTMAQHPLIQRHVAEMHLELDAARKVVDRVAHDFSTGVDHGPASSIEVFSAKWRAATAAIKVVDLACEVVGGASFSRRHELERLSRDVRAARFHPGTDAYTHEVIGKALLAVDMNGPRW